MSTNRSSFAWFAALAVAGATMIGAGCDSSDGDDAATADEPARITDKQGRSVESGITEAELVERFGEPVLTSGAIEGFPGGCVYYAIRDMPTFANVWQFCFDGDGEVSRATARSVTFQAGPPPGSSPARQALLARADAVCESEYSDLEGITREVTKALGAHDRDPSPTTRAAVGDALAAFIANLDETRAHVAAFEAPDDGRESLDVYLSSLQTQIDLLGEARTAFLDGDEKTYDELGQEFTETGVTATEQAAAYGFGYCSAASFG